MVDSSSPRTFGATDAERVFIIVPMLAMVAVTYWFALPVVQSLIIPDAPGGRTGPWAVRPILAFHFGAMAVMTAVTLPFLLWPFRKAWAREDAASGTQYAPFHGRPGRLILLTVKGLLLLVIYASALVFYLFSWTIAGPDGIEERLLWVTRNHSYHDIASLETIPDGERSEAMAKNGPWFSITFKSGHSITLSEDNEGITPKELIFITSHVADRSGLPWKRRSDAQPRRSSRQ